MKTETIVELRRIIRSEPGFAEKVDALVDEAAMSRGRAIMFARECDRAGFNRWMRDRVTGRISEKRSDGGSAMHFFKFVGG